MANIFGWEIKRQEKIEDQPQSFTPEVKDDGAVVVQAAGGAYATYVDLEGTVKTEAELVTRYRQMALNAEVVTALDDIVNEAIVSDQDEDWIVRLNMDKVDGISDDIKERVVAEFEQVLDLLNFNNDAYEIFKRWYVDGRMYYHAIINDKAPEMGLTEIRYIDPRKIRKVREVRQVPGKSGDAIVQTVAEYYVYNERGYAVAGAGQDSSTNNQQSSMQGLRIACDSIIHTTSGLLDQNQKMVLSHLHQAIKVLNQASQLEDATVIYCITRAPERRIFYIDVGNLPRNKAEQYLKDMMNRHKNKLVYDASTGELRDDRKYQTMIEDYWFPRREGGRSTEIDTLPAGQQLGEMDHVIYFQKKLMRALGVPVSRLDPEAGFSLGRASEISRDEIKFAKFINRMRKRFSQLFIKTLEKQLVLKGVCTLEEYQSWTKRMKFEYQEDNHFEEMKQSELMAQRAELAASMQMYIGTYYSHEWARKVIFKMSDEDIEEQDEIIAEEEGNPQFEALAPAPPEPPMMMGPDGMPMDPMEMPDEDGVNSPQIEAKPTGKPGVSVTNGQPPKEKAPPKEPDGKKKLRKPAPKKGAKKDD